MLSETSPEFKPACSVSDFDVIRPTPPTLPVEVETFGAIKITPPAAAVTLLLMATLFDDDQRVMLPPEDLSDWLMTMLPPVEVTLTSPTAVAVPSKEILPGEVAVSVLVDHSVADVVIVLLLSVMLEPLTADSRERIFVAFRSTGLRSLPITALTDRFVLLTVTALVIAELSVTSSTSVVVRVVDNANAV